MREQGRGDMVQWRAISIMFSSTKQWWRQYTVASIDDVKRRWRRSALMEETKRRMKD
ncbi:vacuolar protein sorting-associated protein 13D-like [Sesbania bispinosa]|nr:vacuolar protein sorting-associated protein 13D-like [Sesbania bispinosa]